MASGSVAGDIELTKWDSRSEGFVEDDFSDDDLYGLSETESISQSSNLKKRISSVGKVYRKGPGPIEDSKIDGSSIQSRLPGSLDETFIDDADDEEHEQIGHSKAGCRGLIIYFANLAQSPENEVIDVEFIDSLLRGGADINFRDRHGQGIMHAVAREWHTDVADFVYSRNIDVDMVDNYGRSPMHLASAIDYPAMIEWLISHGANIQKQTKGERQMPIHYAAKSGSLGAMKTLIKLGANLADRDYKERTPLFLAVEAGRSGAATFLLEKEAPAGIYDDCGTSIVSLMIDKMPDVASEALEQFQTTDKGLRKKYFYLNYLEEEQWKITTSKKGKPIRQSQARTPLEVIVRYNELDLIMHPVILRLIKMKWELFGKFYTTLYLTINIFYTILWTYLGLSLPNRTNPNLHFYTPLKTNIIRVAFEMIGGVLTFTFIIMQMFEYKRMILKEQTYLEWKTHEIERDIQFCHPRWPEERRYFHIEINLLRASTKSFLRDPWTLFEWFTYGGIMLVIGTRAAAVLSSTKMADAIHYRAYPIVLIFIWLRLMKYCRAFQSLGPFITMLGHVIKDTTKFAFLFFEFFIPYVCAFWILFGHSPGTEFDTFQNTIYQVFLMTLVADFDFASIEKQDKLMSQVLVGTYLAIASIVCFNLYIALLSDTFSRVYSVATANSFMSQAAELLNIEENLPEEKGYRCKRIIAQQCGPLVDFESKDDDMVVNVDKLVVDLANDVERINKEVASTKINATTCQNELNKLNENIVKILKMQEQSLPHILDLIQDDARWKLRNMVSSMPQNVKEGIKNLRKSFHGKRSAKIRRDNEEDE